MSNPLLSLDFEPLIENLGDTYWDIVEAGEFNEIRLRFRNDSLLKQLGLAAEVVTEKHLEEAFGNFRERFPLLALRYHGYQFGTYNPFLGDGRGFLYGQVRDRNGDIQDLGTKGSGTTPWSRGGDGRLTLKGGLREIIASEALHRLGVTTSRTLSLVETGDKLWRSDEPSPARGSVMVRVARTHLRFGTCERLLYLRDPKGLERLLRHVIEIYYPEILSENGNNQGQKAQEKLLLKEQLLAFYGELVKRVARLAAEWMAAGFTHGVLNTDNMSLAGESFDYGPFAFLSHWDPNFTAAYFDQSGLYAFGRQPTICLNNLRLLQEPLAMLIPREPMEEQLQLFQSAYKRHYLSCMHRRLGFPPDLELTSHQQQTNFSRQRELVESTLQLLATWDIGYGQFFSLLTQQITKNGLPEEPEELQRMFLVLQAPPRESWMTWRDCWWLYQNELRASSITENKEIPTRLERWNLAETPTRETIENLWEPINQHDDWQPFNNWLKNVAIE